VRLRASAVPPAAFRLLFAVVVLGNVSGPLSLSSLFFLAGEKKNRDWGNFTVLELCCAYDSFGVRYV
jgi:hypothetical protein